MFQSFTGSSRRPRQVNLSGRTNNPFAAFPGSSPSRPAPHASNPQSAVAIAQQERMQRQRDRDKQNAVRVIQRVWRGDSSRRATHNAWRLEWDTNERLMTDAMDVAVGSEAGSENMVFSSRRPAPYATADQCLGQLRLLVQFVSARKQDDVLRLVYFVDAFEQTLRTLPTIATEGEWTKLLKRLALAVLRALNSASSSCVPSATIEPLLRGAVFLAELIPKQMAVIADSYYDAMAFLTTKVPNTDSSNSQEFTLSPESIKGAVLALLRPITSETMSAYESFATSYLTIPDLERHLGKLDDLADQINYRMLALAVSSRLNSTAKGSRTLDDMQARIWLFSYLIFFHRYALGGEAFVRPPELEFVSVISDLLTSTATHLMQGLEAEDPSDLESPTGVQPLHPFIKEQLTGLVNQSSVTGLLSPIRSSRLTQSDMSSSESDASKEAQVLATYALNLLRIFPRRGDDIRMWLYLGSAPSGQQNSGQSDAKVPAIKYFWQASRSSRVFQIISSDSTKVLPLLQSYQDTKEPAQLSRNQRDQEWTTILLFLELYTFVLKVMDDDEFFSSTSSFASLDDAKISWTRESALPLEDVKNMTVFLKNLAFTLYWNAVDLSEPELRPTAVSLSSYFSNTGQTSSTSPFPSTKELEAKSQTTYLPGVTGIPLEYFKGLVTGLLRMLHERDSRRKFLPKDHWLMTSRFDMEGFISSVVAEEERRHEFQTQADDPEDIDLVNEEIDRSNEPSGLAGTGRAQQTIRIEALRRNQQRAVRGRILAAIAPRLEILRNMPFFIPFTTRVQIFREFIYHDQHRRRNGFVEPDAWRVSVAQMAMINGHQQGVQDVLARHQAEIRREHIFDDALGQFYQLGDGLKEPIQISFIDRFGSMEAGIDGGGVTKEFLTSITSEAFKTEDGFNMFAENDQHLLYPNPTAVEQCKEQMRENQVVEQSTEWTGNIRELLRRYEFLGRIIGKCLYEGILVDVNFAPFFLLKWALTGGSGSALKESSYRANINDLKDLDAGLYQGLLKLKNYPGEVEDFALDFTVTDTIPMPGSNDRMVTKELRPDGSNIPVTNQNRLVYISYIARYRLQAQPVQQTNAFLQGLGQIIQPSWLSMFNQSELQTLVSGETGDIDVEDLRRNTQYGGVYVIGDDNQEHPTIQLFWKVLHEMNTEEKQKVLRFVTSTPRAPLLGFSHLHPRFSIRDSSEDQERLPSTSTCVNLLKLPRYSNAERLRTKLLYAVSSGAGFDLS
ncbi:uncharacterized protein N7503_005867 [Penicillium pulvis]|uniref:uncharacterized protein n=1 Tax=Penicillium pulvis TaxID=1562058 RepID=UPI0025473A75|nr:uncharacterized protein N7503_005867 [Penicillium pulvis]KAJ5803417.1 hypothetical protein N7503_005867 [Penicillium pulvis]